MSPPEGASGPRGFRALRGRPDVAKLLAMMGLSFLVLLVVGILRPVRSAIALAGLEPGDFYQVYFVSAIVVLVVPIYNRLADRLSWQKLIPGTAMFFAASLVLFRLAYQPGVAWYGLVFYGWYDLLVASLITQFFMATQMFYNARDAKRAYPIVIAAGSTGAALGGATSYLLAERLGAENMLPLAGAIIFVFAIGIALVWAREAPESEPSSRFEDDELVAGDFKRIFSHPQVRLIATTVLLTVLVKQFLDYEYNTLIREVFTDVDEITGFLGLVDAATQWLPIVVLLSLRPILRRWGAGVTVLIFPVAIIIASGALAVSVWLATAALAVAVGARTTEKMFRYSAERTGREILYVPVPEDIKLKAKAYIDVGVEKGLGKVLSGVLLAIPAVAFASMSVASRLVIVGFIGLGLAVLLLFVFLRVRREYVTSLEESFEGRFASVGDSFVSMTDSGALEIARGALADENPLKVAFTLELLKTADAYELEALSGEIQSLLAHPDREIRMEALGLVSRLPAGLDVDAVSARLEDESARVRELAIAALASAPGADSRAVLAELLGSTDPRVRAATLACLANGYAPHEMADVAAPHFERLLVRHRSGEASEEEVIELALAAGVAGPDPRIAPLLKGLIEHENGEIASASVGSAAARQEAALLEPVIESLASSRTRPAARHALANQASDVVEPLVAALDDPSRDSWVRRGAASVLGDVPSEATIDTLIASYMRPETEQALDDQALRSLHRIRSARPNLAFPVDDVLKAVDREIQSAERYQAASDEAARLPRSSARELLLRALGEALEDRRTSVFRWLGLIYSEPGMRRSQLALSSAHGRTRANALEWIESTVGHTVFKRLTPVLKSAAADDDGREARQSEDAIEQDEAETREAIQALRQLWDDEDLWIARCAIRAVAADPEALRRGMVGFEPQDPGLRELVAKLKQVGPAEGGADLGNAGQHMELIEKVFLLQNVDLLAAVSSRQLSLLAAIARDMEVAEGAVLVRKDEPPEALYVVVQGEVVLTGVGDREVRRAAGQAVGTWAFIDDQPSPVEATAAESTRVLRILRDDFRDLLVDHPELGLDLLQGLARRVRTLAAR